MVLISCSGSGDCALEVRGDETRGSRVGERVGRELYFVQKVWKDVSILNGRRKREGETMIFSCSKSIKRKNGNGGDGRGVAVVGRDDGDKTIPKVGFEGWGVGHKEWTPL